MCGLALIILMGLGVILFPLIIAISYHDSVQDDYDWHCYFCKNKDNLNFRCTWKEYKVNGKFNFKFNLCEDCIDDSYYSKKVRVLNENERY